MNSKRIVASFIISCIFVFNMTAFADFIKIDSENSIYYEMYDFSEDVHGTVLKSSSVTGVNSGFVLQNTGSGATVYNDGADAYIKYFASDDNAGTHRLTKIFETSYDGNEVTLIVNLRTNDAENTGKRIRVYDSDGTDYSIRMPDNSGNYTAIVAGNTYLLSPFTYNDNIWHEFKIVFNFSDKQSNIYFDGAPVTLRDGITTNIPLDSNFNNVYRLGLSADIKGKGFDVNDVLISNVAKAIPESVKSVINDNGTMSLSAGSDDVILYATGATKSEALSALVEPIPYTAPIVVTNDKPYIATYSISKIYQTESVRKIHKYTEPTLVTLDVLKHISPYSTLVTGGVSNTDTLSLGAVNNEITVSGINTDIENIWDSSSHDNPGKYVELEANSYVDINFSAYEGSKSIKDMKIVLGKINNNASYDFELLYKKSGEDDFVKFYKSQSEDTTVYTNPVYPTEVLTGFNGQIADVDILRIKFNLAAQVYEIDLNTETDSDSVNASRDSILKKIIISKLYSNNAILQRDAKIKIHGYGGENNGNVKIELIKDSDNKVVREATVVSENYKWNVIFDGISGSLDTYTLKVTDESDDTNYAQSTGILFGDVFIASGQSNMEMTLNNTISRLTTEINTTASNAEADRIKAEIDENAYGAVRILNQSNMITALSPLEEAYTAKWVICDSFENTKGISALPYFFAKELYEELGKEIPVGVMLARRGGTKVKAWMPEDYFNASVYGDANKELTDYNRSNYLSYRVWVGSYNALVSPLTATNINGVIWYQGEDDTDIVQGYKQQFKDLVAGWRDKFNNPELSFNVVMVAPYGGSPNKWDAFRQTQMQLWQSDLYNTLVNTIDIGENNNIHPADKAPLGERLALAVMSKMYDSTKEWSGPLFESLTKEGDNLVVKFTHSDSMASKKRELYSGVFSDLAELSGFEISADGETWVTATAKISGDTVIVSGVENPISVRYAWANFPENPSLYNGANLPALPFVASVNKITATPAVNINGDGVTISGNVSDNQNLKTDAMLIIAKIKDGAVKSVEIKEIGTILNETKSYNFTTTKDDADSIRVMITDKNLRPLVKIAK